MKRWLVLILLVSLSFNVGLLVKLGRERPSASWRGGDRGRGTWPALADSEAWHLRVERRAGHMVDHLGLDPHQREAFREHHRETAHVVLNQRRELEAGRRRLRELVLQQPLDPDAVRAAIAGLGRAQAGLDSLVADKLLEEMEILEPEQRLRMLRMLPWEDHGRHGRGGQGRGGREGGSGHERRHDDR